MRTVSDQRWKRVKYLPNQLETKVDDYVLQIEISNLTAASPDYVECDMRLIDPKMQSPLGRQNIAFTSYNFQTDNLNPDGSLEENRQELELLLQHREVVESRTGLPADIRGYALTLMDKINEALTQTVATPGRFPH